MPNIGYKYGEFKLILQYNTVNIMHLFIKK